MQRGDFREVDHGDCKQGRQFGGADSPDTRWLFGHAHGIHRRFPENRELHRDQPARR